MERWKNIHLLTCNLAFCLKLTTGRPKIEMHLGTLRYTFFPSPQSAIIQGCCGLATASRKVYIPKWSPVCAGQRSAGYGVSIPNILPFRGAAGLSKDHPGLAIDRYFPPPIRSSVGYTPSSLGAVY